MRKLVVSSFVSLDGVIESPMIWASRYFDDECKQYALRKLDNVEYFLLGRVAYETFSPVWPQVKGNPYMDRINGLKKFVASKTIRECSWNATVIAGDVSTELRTIKEQSGGDIMKYGITQLDQTLLASRLIDEYQLWIMPLRVGEGKRAFADVDPALVNLELFATHTFKNGTITLSYRVR
jgi:dihydrofolate reductase